MTRRSKKGSEHAGSLRHRKHSRSQHRNINRCRKRCRSRRRSKAYDKPWLLGKADD